MKDYNNSCQDTVSTKSKLVPVGMIVCSLILGVIFILCSSWRLLANERGTGKVLDGLTRVADSIVSVNYQVVDPANEGKLVHMNAAITTEDSLSDPLFGVTLPKVLRLKRSVKTRQWVEKATNYGDSKHKDIRYSYSEEWREEIIPSDSFKKAGHNNPLTHKFPSRLWTAATFDIGAFHLTPAQGVELLNRCKMDDVLLSEVKTIPPGGVMGACVAIFFGKGTYNNPRIGDTKVTHHIVKTQEISLYGKQTGSGIEPFQTGAGQKIFKSRLGVYSTKEMLTKDLDELTFKFWKMRAFGVAGFFLGLFLVVLGLTGKFRSKR